MRAKKGLEAALWATVKDGKRITVKSSQFKVSGLKSQQVKVIYQGETVSQHWQDQVKSTGKKEATSNKVKAKIGKRIVN